MINDIGLVETLLSEEQGISEEEFFDSSFRVRSSVGAQHGFPSIFEGSPFVFAGRRIFLLGDNIPNDI